MKKSIFLLTAVLLCTCNSMLAQYDPEYDRHGYPSYSYRPDRYGSYNSDYEDGWGTFYAEYSPMQMVSTAKGVDNKTFHTATIGISYNIHLGASPVYLEPAFEVAGSWFSRRYNDGVKYSMNVYYSKIPLNLAIRLNIAEGFAIVPFGGVNVKYNFSGEEREKDANGYTQSWRLFKDNHTYDSDYKRFQAGYQAGVKFIIGNCFSIGASWKADFTPFCKYYDSGTKKEEKEKFQGFAFSLAYCF